MKDGINVVSLHVQSTISEIIYDGVLKTSTYCVAVFFPTLGTPEVGFGAGKNTIAHMYLFLMSYHFRM